MWCIFARMFCWGLKASDLDDLRLAQCIPIPGIPIVAVGFILGIQGMKRNAKTRTLYQKWEVNALFVCKPSGNQ